MKTNKKLIESFKKDLNDSEILTDVFLDAMKNDPRTQDMKIDGCYPVVMAAVNIIAMSALADWDIHGSKMTKEAIDPLVESVDEALRLRISFHLNTKKGGENGN